ncbi:GNAT family N-acetyltransferase [Microlunatus soli]|uniref:GNAT family N-acetyltransferase n=1 Tax=Microlunatus soli TaxID=630515 RepID=UPI000B1AA9E5|nr:GNAT family N-acetyltransferase [Microlunatus soli]
MGGAIYNEIPGAGTLWQLSVHPALRSCGIGRILINALEQRMRARGVGRAELGVDEPNVRARALYERLGYVAHGRETSTWDPVAEYGSVTTSTMMYTLMRKDLGSL